MSLKQIAIIGGSVSAAAGGAAGIYYFASSSSTIQETLTKENFKLIADSATDKIWKTAWNEIDSDSEIKTTEPTVTSFETLKTWCTTTYKESGKEKTKLEKVKKLCQQPPSNIGEKLTRKGKSFTNNWGAKLTNLKKTDKNGELLKKLQTTTKELQNVEDGETTNNALKKWCESRKPIILPETGGVADYTDVVEHCVD